MKKIATVATFVAAAFIGNVTAQSGAAAKLTAQDLLDIRQLIDGYSHILDNCTNNGNDYADLYTADATFGVSSEWGKAKIWFRGREQLRRAGGGTDAACRPRESQGYAYHLTINPVITATPTGARAISTLLTITNDTNNRGDIVHWEGGYEDTFEKTPAGWRFKSRVHVWPEVEWTDRVEDMPPRKLEEE
jgi:SnoaL-like domain